MNRIMLPLAAAGLIACAPVAGTPAAWGATFSSETGPNSFTVYSTSEKPAVCAVVIRFTFVHNGERKDGNSVCTKKTIPAGEHVQVCAISHEKLVLPEVTALEPDCD